MKNRFLTLAAPALLAAAASSVQAVPSLTLESGGFSVTKTDLTDSTPLDGKIQINQAIGNFFINNATALTDPALGSPADPELNLISVDTSSTLGGQLTVTFTDDGFTGSPLELMASITGNTSLNNTVQLFTYVNGTELTESALLSGFGFKSVEYGSLSEASSYSLTLKAIITHAPSGSSMTQSSSFNARLQTAVPDGGASAMLLGLGLIGLGAFARRSGKN